MRQPHRLSIFIARQGAGAGAGGVTGQGAGLLRRRGCGRTAGFTLKAHGSSCRRLSSQLFVTSVKQIQAHAAWKLHNPDADQRQRHGAEGHGLNPVRDPGAVATPSFRAHLPYESSNVLRIGHEGLSLIRIRHIVRL